ncbi:MAG: hypothetical protein D4R84_04835 [Rhodocyclaceae bacterium]|nr:MAG: hypothetical protein D4R84_04835 [Rhodocyclaceae bacterium]
MLPLLAINAIVMMAAALVLWLAPELLVAPPQAVAHLAFALGAMPLILAAIAYFVPVLTRGAGPTPWLRAVPLLAWLAGAVIIAGFTGLLGLSAASHVAFVFAGAAACAMLLWMLQRGRATLGAPHPGLAWYLAAVAFLAAGLLAVPAMALWPEQRAAFRQFHLHVNLLGFVGLTAIGTLQVLLPTSVGRVDFQASGRLATDLKFACTGVLLLAAGAALAVPGMSMGWAKMVAVTGALLFMWAPLRMATYWVAAYSERIGSLHGAAASLALACLGLIGLMFAGIGHTLGFLAGRDAVAGFVLAFLLPLVSGAATQLLPVWLRPGMQGEWHHRLRSRLGRLAGLRALLMVCGGLAIAFGWPQGIWLALAGVAILVFVAAPSVMLAMA